MDLLGIFNHLPPLKRKVSPFFSVFAATFGFIGLAIYFRSIIDFFIPLLIVIILLLTNNLVNPGNLKITIGAHLVTYASQFLYAWFRATSSNKRLDNRNRRED